MPRHHSNWLTAYTEYSGYTETPARMRFWAGVSAIAGALRRRVHIDQYYFQWHPNFYIIFVAEPDIVSKSTTTGTAMKLLRQVPDIVLGPNVATWQALVQFLGMSQVEQIGDDGKPYKVAPITISSSEFGNFLNPADREMVDLMVSLWDGSDISKVTKMSGKDEVPFPLLNLNACTTPAWITGNIPQYMLGGGLLSRCIFVHATEKEQYVAYPGLHVPGNIKELERKLVEDLTEISLLSGEFAMTREAVDWGQTWYEKTFKGENTDYITRKQTHVHKLAMILAAAKRQDNYIDMADLMEAEQLISRAGQDLHKVLESVGRAQEAGPADRLVQIVEQAGRIKVDDAYAQVHGLFPKESDFTNILGGITRAGKVRAEVISGVPWLIKK